MQITVTQADGVAVVRIGGELRIASVADAKPELVAVLASGSDVQVDLARLEECDTAGVQLLLMTFTGARAKCRRCTTIGHSAAFRAALERAGIPAEPFEFQAAAADDGNRLAGRR